MARWIIDGEQPMDLWSADIRRFTPAFNNRAFLRDRVAESARNTLSRRLARPRLETGRGLRTSPLHDRLAAHGACFGVKMGMEAAAPVVRRAPGSNPVMEYAWGRQNWFENHAAERPCRP